MPRTLAPPVICRRDSRTHAVQSVLPILLVLSISAALLSSCPSRRPPAPPRPYAAFVVNDQSGALVAVDLAKFRVLVSVPVGQGPERAVARPGSHELYVTSSSGTVSIMAFPELRVVRTLYVGRTARDLAFSSDGSQAFVLDPAGAQVIFVDATQRREIARVRLARDPSGAAGFCSLALTPNGKTLIAAEGGRNRLSFIDVDSRSLVGRVDVGTRPGPMVILPDGTKVFVADTGEEKVSVVDITAHRVLSHIETGARPSGIVLKPDGGEVFVLSARGNNVTILDASHDELEQTIPTGHGPAAAAISRDAKVLYIASAGDGTLTALDVETRSVLASVHVGIEPRALALTPDERFVVVADAASASLAVLRADHLALLTMIPVGPRPVAVVIPNWLSP